MRSIAGLASALLLASCASLTPAQNLERADTAALVAYSATAKAIDVCEAANPSCADRGEALRSKAWGLLEQEHQLYHAGQDVTAVLAELQALEAQAKGL